MFFTAFVLCIFRVFKLKTGGQTIYQKASLQSYKTQIKFFKFILVSFIGL